MQEIVQACRASLQHARVIIQLAGGRDTRAVGWNSNQMTRTLSLLYCAASRRQQHAVLAPAGRALAKGVCLTSVSEG